MGSKLFSRIPTHRNLENLTMAKKSRTTAVLDRPTPDKFSTETKMKSKRPSGQNKEDRTPIAPDADELELERLVFGDLLGFKESLKQSAYEGEFLAEEDKDESDESDVEKREEEEPGPRKDLTALNDDEVNHNRSVVHLSRPIN